MHGLEIKAGGAKIIRASIQVTDENGPFMVEVHADTLRQAVDFATKRYPDCIVGFRFPLDSDTFFVGGSSDEADTVELTTPQKAPAPA